MFLEILFLTGVLGVAFAGYSMVSIERKPAGNAKMREISGFIREGAFAYLKKQYSILAVFIVLMAALLFLVINGATAVAYVFGAVSSILAGFLGMNGATKANVRTAQAATKSIGEALKIAFSSGTILSFAASGLGIIGIVLMFWLFNDITIVTGFALGASSVALFARVGGGIYTKAADVGADLVGKVESGIPEDDPRTPAVIADLVGDNVGDVAGMGADLFESISAENIGAMVLGVALYPVF